MSNLTILAFDNPAQAFLLRDALLNLQGEALFDLSDIVVITRDAAGKVELHQTLKATAGLASAGSVTGLILGAIFTVPWLGSAMGSGVGALVGKLADLGIDDRFMKELGATLRPGTSALALLGTKARLDELGKRVGPELKGATLLQTTVDEERESEIRALLNRSGS
jgi:uncharacterized membrane protein